MQQSLVKVYENEEGDIVLLYIDCDRVNPVEKLEPQMIIIDIEDAETVANMLSSYIGK
jgi:hypothetical protein